MICKPLALPEQGNTGFTHFARVTADDLTNTTAAAAQTITLMNLSTGDVMDAIEDNVTVPFQCTTDAAFNTTTRTLGDNSAVTTHTAAAEANANGTVVPKKYSKVAVGPYTAANTVTITFNSMAAKSLSTINRGEIHVFIKIIRATGISAGAGTALITTK